MLVNILLDLKNFLLLVTRLVPRLGWWALVGMLCAVLNILFKDEVWPNTPLAVPVARLLGVLSLLAGQWAVVITSRGIRPAVQSTFWWACWSLLWLLSIAGFAGMMLLGVIAVIFPGNALV